MTTTAQNTQGSITDRAMLIGLNIRQWSASKNDKKITQEVADNHRSDVSMGRYHKALVAKEALEKVKKTANAARTEHYARTLPWGDDGARILTANGYFAYAQKMADLKAEFESAVSHFIQAYPRYVDDAMGKLNGLFDPAEYPGVSIDPVYRTATVTDIRQITRKFEFNQSVKPLPDSADFRVQLGDDETARIKQSIKADLDEAIETAMRDVWTRCHTVVSKMSERLKAYSPTPNGAENVFRDSLVGNIVDLLELLPSLNLTNDPALSAVARKMRDDLTSYSASELREQDTARARVANSADAILKTMEDFI